LSETNRSVTLQRLVAAALVDGRKVLLVQRAPQRRWYANLWDLPGGHVEADESEAQAVVREVSEELGVLIPEPTGIPVTRLFEVSESGVRLADLSVWVVNKWDGLISNKSPREHRGFRWFTASEIVATELAHPEYQTILPRLISSGK
jgi:8-oxo-dGTP diphosphatase